MMGRFALTESMGRYSLPKQLDSIFTWKVKIKETHQVQYHTITTKKQDQYKHRKTITSSLPTPPTLSNATHSSPPPLPLHSLIGMGWVWVWSWIVRVTIQFPSASSAVVNEIHRCIASFWVQISVILLFLFHTTIPLSELIAFVVPMRLNNLLFVVLWSFSTQSFRIDVLTLHCDLLTSDNSCDMSLLILLRIIKLLC